MRAHWPWRRDSRPGPISISGDADDDLVTRDAEESLVAALQESDTAVEALQDAGVADAAPRQRRRLALGTAGVILATLGFLVRRRRRR